MQASRRALFQHPIECISFYDSSTHGRAHVTLESVSIVAQILGSLFVEGVRCVRFEKQELENECQPSGTIDTRQHV